MKKIDAQLKAITNEYKLGEKTLFPNPLIRQTAMQKNISFETALNTYDSKIVYMTVTTITENRNIAGITAVYIAVLTLMCRSNIHNDNAKKLAIKVVLSSKDSAIMDRRNSFAVFALFTKTACLKIYEVMKNEKALSGFCKLYICRFERRKRASYARFA